MNTRKWLGALFLLCLFVLCPTVIAQTAGWVVGRRATCTAPGSQYWEDEAGNRTTAEIPALGHHYSEVIYEPSCEGPGRRVKTCVLCGDTITEDYGEPLGHVFQETMVVEPICGEPGSVTEACRRCGVTQVTQTAIGQHTFGEWYVEKFATPFNEGEYYRVCSKCGLEEYRTMPLAQSLDRAEPAAAPEAPQPAAEPPPQKRFPLTLLELLIISAEVVILLIFIYLIVMDVYAISYELRQRHRYKKRLAEIRKYGDGYDFR